MVLFSGTSDPWNLDGDVDVKRNMWNVTEIVPELAASAGPTVIEDDGAGEAYRPVRGPVRRTVWKVIGNFAIMIVSILSSALAVELFIRCFVTVQNVGPSFSTYDPTLLRMLKKNLTCIRYSPEFSMRMSTNSHGFRGPELPPAPRDCVLMIGDSQSMGHGVNDGEEYLSLLRKDLEARYGPDRFAVINAAIGGLGNGRWIRILRGDVWGYRPRLVILQFSSTDFGDNDREGIFKLSQSGELIEFPTPPPGMGFYLDRAVDSIPGLGYSHTVGLFKQVMARKNVMTFIPNPFAPRGSSRLTFRLLEESIAICRRRDWPVLVLATDHGRETLAETEQLCDRLRVPLVAIPTKFERPDLFFPIDPHWNRTGQRYVANLLEAKMAAEGMLLGSKDLPTEMRRTPAIAPAAEGRDLRASK